MNHLTVDSHNESFHEVSQLPNVARPVVTHQNTHRFTRDAFEFSAMPLAEMLEEMFDQERDIFPSFSKRWELQWNDIQSVVQVLSKFSLVNERRNVTPRTLATCGFERRAVSPPRATQTASMLRTVQPIAEAEFSADVIACLAACGALVLLLGDSGGRQIRHLHF